jgi:hypothetical protein
VAVEGLGLGCSLSLHLPSLVRVVVACMNRRTTEPWYAHPDFRLPIRVLEEARSAQRRAEYLRCAGITSIIYCIESDIRATSRVANAHVGLRRCCRKYHSQPSSVTARRKCLQWMTGEAPRRRMRFNKCLQEMEGAWILLLLFHSCSPTALALPMAWSLWGF